MHTLRTFALALAIVFAILGSLSATGCGLVNSSNDGSDNAGAVSAPSPVVVSTPPLEPQTTPVASEPFCPFQTTDNLQASRNGQRMLISWNVATALDGSWLKRYQIEVARYHHTNEFRTYTVLERQVDRLSGPHNKRAEVEWLTADDGRYRVRVRVWYPNECHGDANNPGARLNGPWSEWKDVER
jgi:hypothetical protein